MAATISLFLDLITQKPLQVQMGAGSCHQKIIVGNTDNTLLIEGVCDAMPVADDAQIAEIKNGLSALLSAPVECLFIFDGPRRSDYVLL